MTEHDDDRSAPLPKTRRLDVKVEDDLAGGVYTNLVMVHQTDSEMVIDFLFLQPGRSQALLRSRVITSPRHVKRLIGVLQEQMAHYERLHGEVKLPKPPEGMVH